MLPGLSHTGHIRPVQTGQASAPLSAESGAPCSTSTVPPAAATTTPTPPRTGRLDWTQTNYVSPQMHAFDRLFYDPAVGYTVDKYLADVEKRYGGVDSILLWPTCARPLRPPPCSRTAELSFLLSNPQRNVSWNGFQPEITLKTHVYYLHRYPNIGVDTRSQIDLFRAMPGRFHIKNDDFIPTMIDFILKMMDFIRNNDGFHTKQ